MDSRIVYYKMAKHIDDIGMLSISDTATGQLILNENIRTAREKFQKEYETIFSWKIQEVTQEHPNYFSNFIDRIREMYDDSCMGSDNAFDLYG